MITMTDTPFFRTGLDAQIIGPLARDPARLRKALELFRSRVAGPALHPDAHPDDTTAAKAFAGISGAIDELLALSNKKLAEEAQAYMELVNDRSNDPMLRKVIRGEFEGELNRLTRELSTEKGNRQTALDEASKERGRAENLRTVFSDALQQIVVRFKFVATDCPDSLFNFRNRYFCSLEEKKEKDGKVWKLILKLYLVANDGWVYENRIVVLDRQGAQWTSVESDEAIKLAARMVQAARGELRDGKSEGWKRIGLLIGFMEHIPNPGQCANVGALIQREDLKAEFTEATKALAIVGLERHKLLTGHEALPVVYIKFEPAHEKLTNFFLKP